MWVAYAFGHWGLTLILSPFISYLIEHIWKNNLHQMVGLVEAYPLTFLLSIFFSFPTFIVYVICFYFLCKYNVKWMKAKAVLIIIAVLGVNITFSFLDWIIGPQLIVAYSLTTTIVGLLLNLKPYYIKS